MRKRILALFISLALCASILPGQLISFAENADFDAFMNYVPEESIAYCNFYGKLESRNASFIDGVRMGITDAKDPLYFEEVVLDGYEGRKQYRDNTTYINIEEDFYNKDDNHFIVNIYYYDFGPSEGTYYLEYRTTGGVIAQKAIIKPGNYPGWTCISLILEDCDLSPHYENGASLRIQNGAYNAWRKVEVINVSKYKKEKKDIEGLTYMGLAKRRALEKSLIVPENEPIFLPLQVGKPATVYDVKRIINSITMKNEAIDSAEKEKTLTQGALLKMFMDIVDIKYNGKESIVDYALEIGFIESEGMFIFDGATATNFNLGSLLNDFIGYEVSKNEPFVYRMYLNGFFGDRSIEDIPNEALTAAYYAVPRKNPYIAITDNGTGRTFKYINFYGNDLLRPYLTSPQWLHDGKRFICGTRSGYLYLYNIETQMMFFLAKARTTKESSNGTVGEDGKIYYTNTEGSLYTMNRIDPNDPELKSEVIYRFPPGVVTGNEIFAANGKWFAGDTSDMANYFKAPEGYTALIVFHVPEKSVPGVPDENYQVGYYKFAEPEKGPLNHRQANPKYPNIIFFAHESYFSTVGYDAVRDRSNVMDLNTGKVWTFNQGYVKNSKNFDLTTHESFSADGEWLTGVIWPEGGEDTAMMGQTGQLSKTAVFKARLDGSHRQVYYSNDYGNSFNHPFFSSDMKWIVGDSGYISLMCADTHQLFPLTSWARNSTNGSHPYHAHAQIARGHYIASWGHTYKGVLGVAWYDFTHIAENEVAEGGRYTVNEYVNCVAYEDLECESYKVVKGNRDCQMTKAGKAIYYEINPEIADTTNDAIRITFDYLDNDKDPLKITYTSGVRGPNDDRLRFDKEIFYTRRGTGKWKTAVIEIEEANCENVGKFETDFYISGGSAKTYISNIKVEAMETTHKYTNDFTNAGGIAFLKDPGVIYECEDN